ncbi:MAG: hypothetical protein GY773_16645 [Actinomycetia bacterium]|nr:hypothetical protein [Actinomycetes bacterium]
MRVSIMGGDYEVDDDDRESFEDHEIDQILRQRFDRAFPMRDTSLEVLGDIRPAVTRARRRYVAGRAVSWSVAASLLVVAGALALDGFVPADESFVAAVPADSNGGEGDDGGDAGSAPPLPTPVAPSPAGDDNGETVAGASSKAGDTPPTTGSSADGVTSSVSSPSPETSGSSTTVAMTTPPSSAATTTSAPSTTGATTGTTLDGPCGSVIYRVKSNLDLELVEVEVTSIFEEDIEEDGPEKIKVKFKHAGDRCDLEVKYVDGELRSTVGDD